ncbi:MAG: hypothetical protein HYW47_07555 [Deltaproteobacteria bacterium]|nr:hypothetical protein [Deltaproteobacteria bacterium]
MMRSKKIILLLLLTTSCSFFERKSIYNTQLDFEPQTQQEISALLTIEEGVLALSEKNILNAKKNFENAIVIDRKNPYSYFFLGVIAIREENPQKALGYFQRTLSLLQNKDFWLAQTYKYLGISNYILEQNKTAQSFFIKSQTLNSEDKEVEEYLKLLLDSSPGSSSGSE